MSDLISQNLNMIFKTPKGETVHALKNVSFTWSCGQKAIEECSFSIPGVGLWMLVGNNGSGKSTLFRLISGMITPQRGSIYNTYKSSLMFQNPDHQLLLPSCGSDLMLSAPQGLSASDLRKNIDYALSQVGLAGMFTRPIHTLSGGQKQRLALAGALLQE